MIVNFSFGWRQKSRSRLIKDDEVMKLLVYEGFAKNFALREPSDYAIL